jgi:hypothetical protein
VLLYQKITKILARLTYDIEVDMEARFQSLNRAFDAASRSVDNMGPQVQLIQTEIEKASKTLRHELSHAVQVCEPGHAGPNTDEHRTRATSSKAV